MLLAAEADGATRFRLIGVGADGLVDSAPPILPTLFDRELDRPEAARPRDRRTSARRLGDGSVQFGAAGRYTDRPAPATDRKSSDQQFGFASASISSSLARIEYSP